ncbi:MULTISPECIES: VPA1269 family protein [unclassified Pseudoalteromonas]|uniref:gamma-mobile-trio integrase GmtZ n=1 Tax=unclassified Pseudoalteromonas TaxID=194690 RepID=UPI0009758E66|nr:MULTISPECIES: VPA1269 family protein [unclassified Pseudoalteromonas]MDN3489695.1 VPA1269 family protein [Pseudoalteromonas sp. APC 3694]
MKKYFYPEYALAKKHAQLLGVKTSKEYKLRYKEDPLLFNTPNKIYKNEWEGWESFLGTKKEFYATLSDAKKAIQALGVTTRREYKRQYKSDPLLISAPNIYYEDDWKGWRDFFDTNQNFYSSIDLAEKAVSVLGITTSTQYMAQYKQDPQLPSVPGITYSSEWKGWKSFLGKEKEVYTSYSLAQKAVIDLGIKTQKAYISCRRNDPLLPFSPDKVFFKEWEGWQHFLNTFDESYFDLSSAKKAVISLGIQSSSEYVKRYKEDPRLPAKPTRKYKDEWPGWFSFLGKDIKFYESYELAQKAALKLGITSVTEYRENYHNDPMLPSMPNKKYAKSWRGWPHFLNKTYKFYTSYADAKSATQALGIKSSVEYKKRFKEDFQLPSQPDNVYEEDWINWGDFLGKKLIQFYLTYEEAKVAVKKLGATTLVQYKQKRLDDPKLPSCPDQVYLKDWLGWKIFLNTPKKEKYLTLIEAMQATQAMNITSLKEYKSKYHLDPNLPAKPDGKYCKEWINWHTFLGKSPKFHSYDEAQQSAIKLGIKTAAEYRENYKKDLKLPSVPRQIYTHRWESWQDFLKVASKFYPTYTEAHNAAKALKVSSLLEYKARYKEDPRLAVKPFALYADDWINWIEFLGLKKKSFKSYEDAKKIIQTLNIISFADYKNCPLADLYLPKNPDSYYSASWTNWKDFVLPEIVDNLEILKKACKILNISNSKQYREVQKKYKQLPSKPDKKFEDWVDWYDLLNIPRPYSYEELRLIVLKYKCKTLKDYKDMRTKLHDPRIPSSPEETYKTCGWTNAYNFLGTNRPYQIKYFDPKWKFWADFIVEFLKSAKAGDTKVKDLCEFVREYIEPNNYEVSPLEFLIREKTNIQPMLDLFEEESVLRKKKWLFSVNVFLNWTIVNFLTVEDPETGEISRIKGARNPFARINFDDEIAPVLLNETNKLALPYQFVKSAREWIFPPNEIQNKTNYSDLKHLHRTSADWIQINDLSLIDTTDPDCIIRQEGDKTFLWLPIYWTYTYALMQLPARGRQIVYCDSGEADAEVPDIKNGSIIWKPNRNKLTGLTKQQGMINKTKDNDFGVHYTSNKTHFSGEGYTIAFMPIELAYWLIKLRKWQEKYNPISKPTKWFDCRRTNLNEVQRKQKGINCFLFRGYQNEEPGLFGSRLASRLAAALFFASKDQLTSATYAGKSFKECHLQLEQQEGIALSLFKSEYTPHSMRVSLINAYVYEFGMPLEVIMKLVGHSSVVMSIYYLKSDKTGANIREKLKLGEKQALSNGSDTLKSFIESQRIEECKKQLLGNNPEFLQTLNNSRPASSYLFKDFGICPVGGAFCREGGDAVATKANIYHPVNAGYLGEQNCIQCRFFVTGPAFMMGLSALFNEVSLAVNTQSYRFTSLEEELNNAASRVDVISHELYKQKNQQLEDEKQQLQALRRKLNSEIETRAKKLDLYMADMNSLHKHLTNCQKVINNDKQQGDSKLQLIVPNEFEISFELDDVSSFQQLSEVCENAELYHSCSDELAVTRRSQALDRMLLNNGMNPQFIFLTEKQQLAVGNQMTQLMLSRLQSWEKLDKLINGTLALNDFLEKERLTLMDIKSLFASSTPLKQVD